MRIAVLSDIHGNLTAFNAVVSDIGAQSPDLVLLGGDLADSGSSPTQIIDQIRDLGWTGVRGNTDEMLFRPEALEDFARQSSAPSVVWESVRAISSATSVLLGEERLAWLARLPLSYARPGFALVHATPSSCWQALPPIASNEELGAAYGSLGQPIVAFGHTHLPSIRALPGQPQLLINTGSVGMPYDGDVRASYLMLDAGVPTIRRVEYDVEKELKALSTCGLPGAEWAARTLRSASPQMP